MTDILRCTPMRAAETNTPPVFALPPGACDAHFHVFEPGYPHVPDPLYTFPDGTTEAYLAMTEALGIERMVLVQPTFYGTDNSLLADVLKEIIADEHVPFLAASRYKASGVDKRAQWERTWDLQREEDTTGQRLDIPAGTSVRFEPGVSREVSLVALAGNRVVPGLRPEQSGPLDD